MAQLEQYRIFTSVAKNKSFGKAALELYITQPAVSQSIKQLEEELGVSLFVRTPRGAELTDEGRMLYIGAEQALAILKGAENSLNELKSLERGTLAIGASDTLCEHFLLPHLKRFHEKYPNVNLRITNRTSRETVALLSGGLVDMGFINLPCETGDSVTVKPLSRLHICFVCDRNKYPKLIGRTVTAAELAEYPLLMLERESAMRRFTDSFLKSISSELRPQTELGSHDLMLSFSGIGLGVALVVREYSRVLLDSGRLSEVKTDFTIPPHEVALITRAKIPLSSAARVFRNMLEE